MPTEPSEDRRIANPRFESKYLKIREFLQAIGEPKYRYRQAMDAVFRQRIGHFRDMTALPKALREKLADEFGSSILTVRSVLTRESDQAEKALFELPDGNRVEAISLKFRAGWESFCISSQCGCGFACSFCATGKIGLLRNMTPDEISDQLLYFLLAGQDIDSISFMGMGEALSNKHIFAAIDIITDPLLFGLSRRRITVSTIGVVPNMRRLSREYPQVNQTLSLHSPFDEQRSQMIPLNDKYPIRMLLETLDEHIATTRRKAYIAYVLIDGVNDTAEHARALVDVIKTNMRNHNLVHVSLIRYNVAEMVTREFRRSQERSVNQFRDALKEGGIKCTVRASFGNDIDAACGQLFANYRPKAPRANVRASL